MKEQRAKMKEQPTPNRGQSNLFELPRCEGGKDREAGLKSKDKNHQFFIVCYLKFY